MRIGRERKRRMMLVPNSPRYFSSGSARSGWKVPNSMPLQFSTFSFCGDTAFMSKSAGMPPSPFRPLRNGSPVSSPALE